MPQPYDANRDDVTDALMGQNKGGALGYGLSGLAGAMPSNMPTAAPPGMPQTPAGGVPGSGLAPAVPSIMPMQPRPQQQGMSLQQNSMGTMPELSGMPLMGGIGAMPELSGAPPATPLGRTMTQGLPGMVGNMSKGLNRGGRRTY
jgi:hypothetical protein